MRLEPGDILIVVAAGAPGGKTELLHRLVTALRAQGLRPVGVKPVETSCPTQDDHDIGSRHGPALHTLMGGLVPRPVLVPYRLRAGGAARDAARAAGLELRLDDLVAALHEASRYGDVLVVESSGPALSPLAEDGTALDLAERVSAKLVAAPARTEEEAAALEDLHAQARARGLELITG